MLSTQSGIPPGYAGYSQFPPHPTAEGLYVVPDPLCTFLRRSFSFGLAEQQQFQLVWLYPMTDFRIGLRGKVILTSESNGNFQTPLS